MPNTKCNHCKLRTSCYVTYYNRQNCELFETDELSLKVEAMPRARVQIGRKVA
jgi:hypothetical protein